MIPDAIPPQPAGPTVAVTHHVRLPDPVKLSRYAKSPELGPRLLFFSGGTALRDTSRELIRFTHNSIHLITPFDSGGSSAILRQAFQMPAIGDVRSRLMALADQGLQGNREIFALFGHRLAKDGDGKALAHELDRMIRAKHPLVARIPDPMRKIIRNHLRRFAEYMPREFDLHGASIGNLVLTAGYLDNSRHFDPVIYLFSKLVEVRGVVRPITNKNLHLTATLENGAVIPRQHLLSGKESPPIDSPVKGLALTDQSPDLPPVSVAIRRKVQKLIAAAELICFPMGSFYSSILANLLPAGVGEAVAANPCPKIYVPSTGTDPECFGLDLTGQIEALIATLQGDAPDRPARELLHFVMIDSKNGSYPGRPDRSRLRDRGICLIDCPLVSAASAPHIDPALLASALLSLT